MNRFNLNEFVGETSDSILQKGQIKESKELVLLKLLKKRFFNWEECLQINELKVARLLIHPHMLQLKEIIRLKKKDELCLVYEPIETSLLIYQNLHKERRIHIEEQNIKVIIYQILLCLSNIHQKNIIHRDIQPENIFINLEGQIKVGNFENCKLKTKNQMTDYLGNRWYRSPEQILTQSYYNQKIDVFATGVIMAELYLNKNLFPSSDQIDHIQRIFKILGKVQLKEWPQIQIFIENNQQLKEISDELINQDKSNIQNKYLIFQNQFKEGLVSNEAFDLMIKMLTVSPQNRWDTEELLKHSFFSKIDQTSTINMNDYWEKLLKKFNQKDLLFHDLKTKQHSNQAINKLKNYGTSNLVQKIKEKH